MQKLALLGFLATASSELLLTRHVTAQGGHQARTATSTDYLSHFCTNYSVPLVVKACGADTSTGGNPGPRDPATPMNLLLVCRDGPSLVCSALGNGIDDMCCQAVLHEGLSTQCQLVVRVFNGGTITTTLVTAQLDVYPAVNDDLKRIPRALMTDPTLPIPPQDQVRPLLTSVATLSPVQVPFNDRRRNVVDLAFDYCGLSNQKVVFGVIGTSLSAESEVFICDISMGATCGNQNHHGTDNVVTVFHSVESYPLLYGRKYFIRLLSFGHEDGTPEISVTIANTAVQNPASAILETYRATMKSLN